jgi:hypothetical protein
MRTTGLVWTHSSETPLTLDGMAAFVAEARDAGVPGDAVPTVGTTWRGAVKRIAVTRPMGKIAPKDARL